MVCIVLQTPAFAEYRLAPGDVLELSVAGFSELRQKSTIGVDGEIVLPLIGSVKAVGRTLPELSQAIRQAYSSAVLQQRVPGGQSEPIVITANEITLQISEYRPIYLTGDVANPGQQPFRPGMTIRQAITVAGGFGAGRAGLANPRLEAAQVRADMKALWVQLVNDHATVWRINCELTGNNAPFPDFSMAPLDQEMVRQIRSNVEEQLKTRRDDLSKQKASIQKTIEQADKRLALLADQLKNEEAGSQADAEDFARVSALFEKGNIAVTRLSDARRTMLFSGTRVLQTTSAISQLERDREVLRRSLEEADAKKRIALNDELQQVQSRIAQAQTKLSGLEERFRYIGGSQTGLSRDLGNELKISVLRKGATGVERISSEEDADLLPGDVVEVLLPDDRPQL
ncbi:polysaccharide biosynthesis/export family protein [Microvirga terrae]|uniref:Polysaccharide biosynthesis/export family protein n=2 Tax=Microvirga terrae TaxID=2740529 RepID=A0ABY5RME2_9HYPH|nr:polysaccharide biosynthesis/export family protein [Microvirga terrae]UVF18400.1 polysaccharide biosynthesis/export family protein [Microvirga terrae]